MLDGVRGVSDVTEMVTDVTVFPRKGRFPVTIL